MAAVKKNIVLGVTGGIAAYKSAFLVRELVKDNFDVRVAMTTSGMKFVTPLTYRTLTNNEVVTDTFQETSGEVLHIWLAQWADLVIIAPATANFIGKYANGIADDFLSTFLLATRAPILICPAMNTYMYEHGAVQENIMKLLKNGVHFMSPGEGALACGMEGAGRMSEVHEIVEKVHGLTSRKDMEKVRMLVTAGRTEEYLDPVRCLTNPSSGKMGYAVAVAAQRRGADVTLISGPTALPEPWGVEVVHVTSAQQMYNEVAKRFSDTEVLIKAAAVSDFRVSGGTLPNKVKKENVKVRLELERNPDILYEMGRLKKHQCLVGFAAETENVFENALMKIKRKNLNFIVANNVTESDAGFCSNTNRVQIIDENGAVEHVPLCSKLEVAHRLVDHIAGWIQNHAGQ